jgi:inorganic triphosphatase YgiF
VLALEVKAQHGILDVRTFQRLLSATALAGFSLEEPGVAERHDCYLDRADSAFRAEGYACRIRRQDSQTLVTLKGLGAASGAIHHRTEHRVKLPETLSPRDWRQSTARDLALHLGSGEPLFLLCEIHQTRHRRLLCDGRRFVAELNWERVRPHWGDDMAPTFLELEVELLPNGGEQDLDRLATDLQEGIKALLPTSFGRLDTLGVYHPGCWVLFPSGPLLRKMVLIRRQVPSRHHLRQWS